jgi:chromosome segregation protein
MLSVIYIKGFKTFARPVRMPLKQGVTTIVGPNGSGKSNITDAVLFALGEGSPSLLRAGSMTDVIFSGSDSSSAAGAAEVTLVLDNTKGRISLPYQEVSLTRRISRDGETEYKINGVRARLSDVRAVAGEAGLGRHSILRQGAVDAIVSGGAAACRTALEEAAGLGVFRRRRLAAARKLERAAAQLESSRRIEAELSEQLQRIEVEAGAAREYRELETRYRELSLAHLYRVATQKLEDRREHLTELDARVMAMQARQGSLREDGRRLEAEEKDLEGRVRTTEHTLEGLERVSEALRAETLRAERASLRLEGTQERRVDHLRLVSRLHAELDETTSEVQWLKEKVDELEEEHSKRKEKFQQLEKLVTRRRAEHAGASGRRRRLAEELEALNERRKRVVGRLEEIETLGSEELRRLEEMGEKLGWHAPGVLRARAAAVLGRLEKLRLLAARRAVEADRRRGALATLVGRTEAEIRVLKASRRTMTDGKKRLYEILHPRPGYEAAVEAALGDLAEGVLTKTLDEGMRLLSEAPTERVIVRLDAEGLSEERREIPGKPLLGCVKVLDTSYTEALERLLGGIYVLEETGWTGPNNGYVAVTREGLRLTRTSASRRAPDGNFARQTRLAKEEKHLEALKNKVGGELRNLREALFFVSRRLDERAAMVEAFEALTSRAARTSRLLLSECERRGRKEKALCERRVGAEAELREVEAKLRATEEELREARGAEERAEEELDTALSVAEAAYTASREADRSLTQTRADLQYARDRGVLISDGMKGLKAAATDDINARLTEHVRRATQHARRLDAAVRGHIVRLRRSRSDSAALQARTAERRLKLVEEAGEVAGELVKAASEAAGLREELTSAEDARKMAEREISDEWGATLEVAREAAQIRPETTDTERARLVRKIKTFGDVNLLAIGQEGRLRERYEFFAAQRADAEEAATEIKHIIQDVDKEIEARFEATFREVRREFAGMVPRMLEGAAGELKISEEGVEIGLKLKGRGWRPLRVLSGGERSLLALSFLFSIFLGRLDDDGLKTFCMLDEAEAALDDLNLVRFLAVVDSYRADGQFLLVTHQKRTMAAADVLYGVSQDPSGATVLVSKRLTGE